VGASVAACKLPGIRAAICHDTYSAHQGVEHDDMNVLCLGSEVIGAELAASSSARSSRPCLTGASGT
jgi:ribose 5-phosphate isomerase B